MGFYNDILSQIKACTSERGKAQKLAQKAGINPNLISRWVNRQRKPNLENISRVMDALGAKIVFEDLSDQTVRPVQISCSALAASIEENSLTSEDYFAVPLLDRSDTIDKSPDLKIKGSDWILLRSKHWLKNKLNLIAVEVDHHEGYSMSPTLLPGDLVVVDKNDVTQQKSPENIYLIRTPQNKLAIRRIHAYQKENLLFSYFDNPQYEPEILKLNNDYDKDVQQIIIGRVIEGWESLSNNWNQKFQADIK